MDAEESNVSPIDNEPGDSKAIGSERLRELLEKSEIYAETILARSAGRRPINTQKSAPKKRGRKSRRDEPSNEPDEEILDIDDGEEIQLTRVDKQPASIKNGIMKPYQIEGLAWLVKLYESGINGILADEMGLGKTLQTISLMAWLREFRGIPGPYLVIAPKTTLGNWVREVNKWCPVLRCFKFHGNQDQRAEMIANEIWPDKYDVFVTSYEVLIKEKNVLCSRFHWQYVIIDEAHRIKNEASKLAVTVRKLRTNYRLLVTGTPLQNNLHELWALLNFLFPEMFNDAEEFDTLFNVVAASSEDETQEEKENRNLLMVHQLHKVLRPFLLRRVKSEVSKELPPKKELLLYVALTPMQRRQYRAILSKNYDAISERGGEGKTRLLNLVMQLRKCCNHPYLFDGWEDRTLDPHGDHLVENSGKLKLLDRLMKRLLENGSRVLIFTQMTRMLDILEDFLLMRNIDYCRIDGSTSGEDRDAQIDAFNAPESSKKVFVLSTRAGGLGINLVTADTVIIFDSDWNPQMDLQAMDRAHRIGQTRPVNVYRLVHENTIEEKVLERATLKLQLDTAIIQQGRLAEKKNLSSQDLLNMIQYGADHIFKSHDGELTDGDLDAILARGETLSKELSERLSSQVKKSVLDFSSDGGSNVYEFEGEDYTLKRKLDRQAWQELSNLAMDEERENKRLQRAMNNPALLNLMNQAGGVNVPPGTTTGKKTQTIPRALRLPPMQDFQFFDKRRLQSILDIEVIAWSKEKELTKKVPILENQVIQATENEKQVKAIIEEVKSLGMNPEQICGWSLKTETADDIHRKKDEEQLKREDDKTLKKKDLQETKDEDDDVQILNEIGGQSKATGANDDDDDVEEIIPIHIKINHLDVLHTKVESLHLSLGETLIERLADLIEWGVNIQTDLKNAHNQSRADAVPAAILEEKKCILAEAFGDWQRKDFNAFIKGCELHGKENLSKVAREVDGKTEDEVTRYASVFFSRYKEVVGWEKCFSKMEEGENRRRRNEELAEEIALRVQDANCPWLQMQLPPPPVTRGRASPSGFFFTDANDRYLLTMTALLGYGRWEDLRALVQRDPRLRFDWFMRSRNASDLGRRVETLVRLMKKEKERDAIIANAPPRVDPEVAEQLAFKATQQANAERRRRRAQELQEGGGMVGNGIGMNVKETEDLDNDGVDIDDGGGGPASKRARTEMAEDELEEADEDMGGGGGGGGSGEGIVN